MLTPLGARPKLKALPWLAVLLVALAPRMSSAADTLPVPWNGMDIGSPSPAGAAREDGGVFTLTGGVGGLAGADDRFHFVYQYLVGDCVLIARVSDGAGPGAPASVGIMARQSLSSDSDFVAVMLTPGHGAASVSRLPYAPRTATETAEAASPVWVKLAKRGRTVQSYLAADRGGTPGSWKQVGGVQPIPSGMIYVGLCLAGRAGGGTATFDHVSFVTRALPLLDNGLYTLSPSGAPNMALVTAADGGVHLAPVGGSAGQKWRLVNKGGSFYSLQPVSDLSLALTVPGAKSASGSPVAVTADRGQDTQRWSIVPGKDGLYSLLPQFDTRIGLDDLGGNATPNAVIDIWNYDSADPHLQWAITPVP